MRQLASIEKIVDIQPIPGSDNIEKAVIKGWELVVKKGEFSVGDLAVYIEVDSIVPDRPEFEFLRPRGFRVKTIKLRGQVSQGIAFPLSILPSNIKPKEGLDVTDTLGVTKYLTPSEREEERRTKQKAGKLKKFMMRYSWFRRMFLSRTQKQGWPFWVSKTDEERIQNMPQVLEQFKYYEVYITEKIDYQSVTFTGQMVKKYPFLGKISPMKYRFVVCSRNLTTNDKGSLYWKIAKKYNIEEILKHNPDLTIQGEQGDTKVQGNKYGIVEPMLWVFNIINHKDGYFYNPLEVEGFCKRHGLESVPILGIEQLSDCGETVSEIVEYSKGISKIGNIPREGVVVRCVENGQKLLSFKVINPEFLLKYDSE